MRFGKYDHSFLLCILTYIFCISTTKTNSVDSIHKIDINEFPYLVYMLPTITQNHISHRKWRNLISINNHTPIQTL